MWFGEKDEQVFPQKPVCLCLPQFYHLGCNEATLKDQELFFGFNNLIYAFYDISGSVAGWVIHNIASCYSPRVVFPNT